MRIAGIIAEYNPFHNGHARHIEWTRRLTGCDYVVACMAGHFTQRGDGAILSKWDRARMALSCGADAVFELPALFAVRTADAFARGGVLTLHGLGVDVLSFGSETDDLNAIRMLAEIQENEPKSVSDRVREKLALGLSQPRAWGEAVAEVTGIDPGDINRPNLTLAVSYLRAIKRYCPRMEACAVKRNGDYHADQIGEEPSASALRLAFARGDIESALSAIPEAARPFAVPDRMHGMDDMLMYRLRRMTEDEMRALPDVAEGLERRLYRLCREASGREALLDALKCKRYTRARLSRMLTHALIGMDAQLIKQYPAPTYARLIGMRRDAAPLMRELKNRASLPIAASPDAIRDDEIFMLECRATDVWALMHDPPEARVSGREFTEKFVTL